MSLLSRILISICGFVDRKSSGRVNTFETFPKVTLLRANRNAAGFGKSSELASFYSQQTSDTNSNGSPHVLSLFSFLPTLP